MPIEWGVNPAVSPSVYLLRGTHAARPAAAPANQDYYYLETDTAGGTLFQSTGSAWVQVAGAVTDVDTATFAALTDVDTTGQVTHQVFAWDATAGKYKPLPGVVGDGFGGLNITGDVTIADLANAASYPLLIGDNAGGSGFTVDTLQGGHAVTVGDGSVGSSLSIHTSGHAGFFPNLELVNDQGQVIRGYDSGVLITAGGVGQYNVTPPGTQPVGGAATAGAAYTATEQAMLQKVYDAARALGLLS